VGERGEGRGRGRDVEGCDGDGDGGLMSVEQTGLRHPRRGVPGRRGRGDEQTGRADAAGASGQVGVGFPRPVLLGTGYHDWHGEAFGVYIYQSGNVEVRTNERTNRGSASRDGWIIPCERIHGCNARFVPG